MIEFRNVTKRYGNNVGLTDASVHISRGDFVFLVGPSGSGKTTFVKLILKEIEPDSGQILLAGRDITHLKRKEIPGIRQKIGMVFQDFRLLEKKTVYENVAFAMEVLHKSRREIRERVPFVLELVDIQDKAGRYPDELSAGEQQRVGIARALANQPRILICDEPTGNLDPITAMDIMELLEQINVRGTTILMVTHAKDIVDRMKKRVVAIEEGRIVRDQEGSYGFRQQIREEDRELYVPGFASAGLEAPGFSQSALAGIQAEQPDMDETGSVLYLAAEDAAAGGLVFPQETSAENDIDALLGEYLDGGEDVYE